jgi:hypothetical protein
VFSGWLQRRREQRRLWAAIRRCEPLARADELAAQSLIHRRVPKPWQIWLQLATGAIWLTGALVSHHDTYRWPACVLCALWVGQCAANYRIRRRTLRNGRILGIL